MFSRNFKQILFTFFSVIFFADILTAQSDGIPELPNTPRLVNNFSQEFPQFLSESETAALENKLLAFNDSTSNQIVIVIVDDLNGYAPYEYSSKLGAKWDIGQKNLYNGIVILIKPTGGPGEREIFIAPGSGLQGVIPDMVAKKIVEREIVPNFKAGNIYTGLDRATDVLMELAKGEYNYKDYVKKRDTSFNTMFIVFIVLFIIVSIVVRPRRRHYTIGRRGTYWGSGGWGSGGGFSGDSFSSGGSSSFDGFGGGGGGFNGGGAGGKW